MRRLGMVLAAVAALVVGGQPIAAMAQGKPQVTAKSREQGKAEAPAVVAAAHLNCNVSDAYLLQAGADPKTKAKVALYEVACAEGPGYILQMNGDMAQGFDCLTMATAAVGKKDALTCQLDANKDPKAGVGRLVAAAGKPCTSSDVRALGGTKSGDAFYEVACQGGKGYIVQTSPGKTPVATDCLNEVGAGQMECTLTSKAQILAGLSKMATDAGKTCTVSNMRSIGADPSTGAGYYEVACGGSVGYVLQISAQGQFQQAIDCGKAQNIAGGCTLTVVDATAENDDYTKLAQTAGFPCQVSHYRYIGRDTKTDSEIVELGCSNRPDGGIGVFPLSGGKPAVYDCLEGGFTGQTCQLTQASVVYPKYTDRLAAMGKNQCKVSGARFLAATAEGQDFIEAACSDGLPGFVISVNRATNKTTELLTCGQAARSGAACSLPTNVAK